MSYNVSIATKPLVFEVFRFINNKVWNALAEYVDNSIQSYLNHKEILNRINPDGKLTVTINIDFENDTITIEDDAFGITHDNYQRAFELANIPLDNKGLNEFGMGMKVSSIWLSNIWKVETSAYGEPVNKTLIFNLQEVVDNEDLELPVLEEECNADTHYTRITLTNLSANKPSPRQLSYIKKHITSIYTQQLREGILNLIINGEQMEYQELKFLKAPHYNSPDGETVLWKKDIDFSAGKYSVKGFIGILETMSTSTDNGFLLFRRGRVIGSSYDDRYRPKVLCGQEGSPQYKRIFGELHLEGFDVSFTKNSFQEDYEFNYFVELLKEDLSKNKSFDIFGQAQNYTKPKTKKEIKNLGTNLIKQIAKGFTKPIDNSTNTETRSIGTSNNIISSIPESVTTKEIQPPTDLFGNPIIENDEFQIPPVSIDVTLSNGEKIPLTIKGEKSVTEQGLYNLRKVSDANNYIATINLSNPIFDRFDKSLATPEGQEQLAYIIEVMVATEISLSQGGQSGGKYFRDKFNSLFGVI